MKLLYAQEMREIDRRASSEYDIPSIILMENAGLRVVEVVEEMLGDPRNKRVVVLAGKGNNGGDGLVAARHLINCGAQVETFLLGNENELTPDAGRNFAILSKMKADIFPLLEETDLDNLMLSLLASDIIVDAIYGIGFKGSLNDFVAQVVRMVNWCRAPVVAVDIPSGVEADTGKVHGEAIQAAHTVSFALPKVGLVLEPGKEYVGTLSVADISIPRALLEDQALTTNLINEAMVAPWLNPRHPDSHKGSYGHTLVVGGSLGLSGAVIMSSMAALRCGSGLVTAAIPESILPIVENAMVEVMTTPLSETGQMSIALEALPAIENLLGTASVCAIGPGMSRYTEAGAIVRSVLQKAGIPVIIDADGLNALAKDTSILKNRQIPIVLTPHPGEMARLIGKSIEEVQSDRIQLTRTMAKEWGVSVVLKGNKTVVANPWGEVYVNITGNPGMATAGSGDVLTGIIAGLIAQGVNPHQAACAGVYLHGLAGDKAAEYKGERGLIAGDLINCLPEVLKQFEQ
ncbi:bifunctional ADP-dependent NAD(P)H-hydrate dehydratase/NAD(P)H-hydrate epimerase [Syntrophomonas palmitatica]|uniref:bifunctional ADP-dependent NAD(P)H-hydrate dehydratase/NAD(P)H-hydrate epimerase n=1 Tax=Syntrophomonas palmitatica TaxID=402877 RepID=UPI0006D201D5|nr:bifunctional ADP-dependent NAD(P)H-hydrate dehydratase/NAD(P)H-hydrate epimerase [Syntrophomonas palmitatica]